MALNTPMKIVLTIVIIFLVGIGFYLMDYQKKLSEIKQLEETLVAKRDQLKTNEKRVRALPEQLKRKEKLESELDALIQEKLPKEDAAIFVPKFIQSMEELIAQERRVTGDGSMEVKSITPGRLEMPGAKAGESEGALKALVMFPKQPFQVNLKAKFSSVIHFLHQLAALKLQRLVTITKIDLSPAEAQVYGQSPTLNVNIPMVAYLNEGNQPEEESEETPE